MVSNNLLEIAAKHYGFDMDTLRFVSDSTNQIYVFNKDDTPYILRFSNRPADKVSEIKAEMDWLYYLASNNIGVSLPLYTAAGDFVISATDNGENYFITSFKTVNGVRWDKNSPEKWNDRIFFNWGKTMGDIHRLTKDYIPAKSSDVRGAFDGRFALDEKVKKCPSVNGIVEKIIGEMMALPKDRDSYGLIHNDMHQWNFFIDGDKINVFDFDDSLYGWFALDIGIALYHALWWGRKNDAGDDFTGAIIYNFLKGYRSANPIDEFWISKIPLFMRFRQICKFSWFFDPNNIDDHQKERIHNIENGILFTGCDVSDYFK